MFEELLKLFDVLEKIEALHAGATTPGERDAAACARERIMERLRQFERDDVSIEQKFTLVNHWSKQLFCALAKRYGLKPYRYYRQRHTTVMLKCPEKFIDDVLWPEFEVLDETLIKSLDEVTDKLIAKSIFQGSTDVEIRDQALLESDVPASNSNDTTPRLEKADEKSDDTKKTPDVSIKPVSQKQPRRNDPCPCGSGKKFKRCCMNK